MLYFYIISFIGGIKMSYDGIVTRAVVDELKDKLVGGRVDKVYQQEKDEILIRIYNKGENHRLVISSSSNNPRMHLTKHSKENPQEPPMFCMLLRKHLIGGTILNIEQFSLDRIIFIDISAQDELGQFTENRIVIELMGKHSNIILINKENGIIMDSVKRVYEDMSRVRELTPGIEYVSPPDQDKKNPLKTSKDEFLSFFESSKNNLKIFKFFYFNYTGLSPLISREICFQADIDIDRNIASLEENDKERLFVAFTNIMSKIESNDYSPLILMDDEDNIIAFYALDLEQFGDVYKTKMDSISKILDKYYSLKDNADRINQKSNSIKKSITVKLDRAKSKLSKQKDELLESKDREKYKVYGDLISANFHAISRGVDKVELDNFYDENMKSISIPLNIKLSPVQNAQRYYKRYSKLKTANNLLLKQIPQTRNEIDYLENVITSLENSTEIYEIDEIKEELIEEGYLRSARQRKKSKKSKISKPHHFISRDNINIYVGKNNRQNDILTFKSSNRSDIWMHVQKMPGSHVIIGNNGAEIPDTTLEDAAILAAYYSKGRNSKNVNIDYTERKNVKKPRGAKAGMVIYNNFKTINVSPDKSHIRKLKK